MYPIRREGDIVLEKVFRYMTLSLFERANSVSVGFVVGGATPSSRQSEIPELWHRQHPIRAKREISRQRDATDRRGRRSLV